MHDTVVSIFYALLLRKNHSRSHARTSCVVLLSASSITRLYSAIDWFCLSHVFSTVLASFLCTFLHESVFFLCFVIVVFSTLFLHKCFFFIYVYESFSLHFSNLHKSKICLFRHLCKLSLCCFDSLIGKMVQFRLFIYSSDCSCPFFFLRMYHRFVLVQITLKRNTMLHGFSTHAWWSRHYVWFITFLLQFSSCLYVCVFVFFCFVLNTVQYIINLVP